MSMACIYIVVNYYLDHGTRLVIENYNVDPTSSVSVYRDLILI